METFLLKIAKIRWIIIVVLFSVYHSAMAESTVLNPILSDRYTFRLGAVFHDPDLRFCQRDDGGDRDCVDQDDLGADQDDFYWHFLFQWRFAQRWKLNASYFHFGWEGDTDTIPAVLGAPVLPSNDGDVAITSDVDVDFYGLGVGYSLLQNEQLEVSVGAGAHLVSIDSEIITRVDVGGGSIVDFETDDLSAPMPNVFINADYALSPQWALRSEFRYLDLDYDNYEGELWFVNAVVDYRLTKHVGLGFGYVYTDMDVEIDKDNSTDEYEIESDGFHVYLTWAFGSI